MQSKMVGMAGPGYPEDRMVKGGGREAPSLGQAHANSMEDYCTDRGPNSHPVSGEISKAIGRSGG